LKYRVACSSEDWTLPEEPVPESQPHDLVLDLLKALLLAFVARTKLDAQVARNLAIRFDTSNPRIGVDPDLCLIAPRTPEGDDLESLRLWEEGHSPPRLCIEVVSKSNARKDYLDAPERYAACGVSELWIFDPRLAGPRVRGGPFLLQVWRRDADDAFTRVYAGAGPVLSDELDAWLVVVDEGRKLRIAHDSEGTSWWLTKEEAERAEKERERAEKERERAEKERERAEKERALARIEELERKLAEAPSK
jgi:hypothetical protein